MDNKNMNALMYSCSNANIKTTTFLLSQINHKDQAIIIDHRDNNKKNCFHHSVSGGNIDLVKMMYGVYQKYEKDKQLIKDGNALLLSLENGDIDITEWILFTIIKDSKQKLKHLNKHIKQSKPGRQFEETLKLWITSIVDKEIKRIEDVSDITSIFSWILSHAPVDIASIKLILSKLPKDQYSKSIFMEKTQCISYSSKNNLIKVLPELLGYLGNYYKPLFEGDNNALVEAILARSDKCTRLILESINKKTKDSLIAAINNQNENALMKAISIKSDKMMELIITHHSNIESILSEAFIYSIQKENVEAALFLLRKAKKKSAILNYKGEANKTALMYALQHKSDGCLKFIVDELKKEMQNDDQKEADLHPMFMERTDDKQNIFHVMFNTKCEMKRIKILESELSKETVFNLLSERDLADHSPLYTAFYKNGIEILQWILDHINIDNNPLTKFEQITSRNKFNDNLFHKPTRDSSKAIQETKPFMAKVITDCLKQIDINALNIDVLKDTFQRTIDWQYPELQSVILSKTEQNKIAMLLNRDNMLETQGGTCLHHIVNANTMEMCKVIFPQITNIDLFHARNKSGRNVLQYATTTRKYDCIKYILDHLKNKTKSIATYIADEYVWDTNAMKAAYNGNDVQIIQLLVSYLKEDEMHIAMQAAAWVDYDGNIIPSLLSNISSNDLKYELLHRCSTAGNTLLKSAMAWGIKQKFVAWFVNDAVKGDDPILVKPTDTTFVNCWLARSSDNAYSDIMEAVLHKFDPESRLQHVLMRSFERNSLLTKCIGVKDKEVVLSNVIISALTGIKDNIDDIDVAFPLFQFAVKIKNIQCIENILSKTAQSIKNKLFINYQHNWNVFKESMSKDKENKSMLAMLIRYIPKTDIMNILTDENSFNFKENTVFQHCCVSGDMDCFNMLLSVYDECKQSYDDELTKSNWQNESLLYLAVKNNNSDLTAFIMQRIENDAKRLKTILQETKDGENIFGVGTTKTKNILKSSMINILENIKTNKIDSESFMSYFQWLIKENELDLIKKLFDIFKHDRKFIIKCMLFVNRKKKQNSAHIACSCNHYKILQYLLSFTIDSTHKENLLLLSDKEGMTPLMISCEQSYIECTSLLLDALKSNQNLLTTLYAMSNDMKKLCNDLECSKLIISNCNNTDLEMLQKIFIYSMEHSELEIGDSVLSRLRKLKIERAQLFDYIDTGGCNALYLCALKGNTKFAKIILTAIDTKTKKSIQFLSGFKSYTGLNLMHAASTSGKIDVAKLILSIFTFPKDINALLLGVNDAGDNPLQLYLKSADHNRCEEIKNFVSWYISKVDKKTKLSLISNTNLNGQTLMDYIENTKFGSKLFEMIVTDCTNAADNDIHKWSRFLHVAMALKEPLRLTKLIVDKYQNNADKLKLFSVRDNDSQNVFDRLSSSHPWSVIAYLLSFINKDNNTLLIRSDVEKGQTVIRRCISEAQRASIMLEKFDSISDVLSMKDDQNKTVLQASFDSYNKMSMILLNKLKHSDLVQLIIDCFPGKTLYYYLEDHHNELMPKLLWSRTQHTQDTLLMRFFKTDPSKMFVFTWILSWIKKLNADDVVKLITATNVVGDTAFHLTVGDSAIKYFRDLLSLLPNQQLKEQAILQQNHQGITAFMKAIDAHTGIAYMMWNTIQNTERKLELMNINCSWSMLNDNWKDWTKTALKAHKNMYISDVKLLIPSFYYALKVGDTSFARAVVNKINISDKNKMMTFLSTKLPSMNGECCLHFASYCKNMFTLQVLFSFMDEIKSSDLTQLLFDKNVIYNEDDKTPLMIACQENNVYIIKYLLSKIENEADKLKMIEMETEYKIDEDQDKKVNVNALWIACWKSDNIECLKALLSFYKKKGIKSIIKHRNNKNQSIYHYLNRIEICECLNVSFSFNDLNKADDDGNTPFLMASASKNNDCTRFIEWILNNKCKNDKEKLQLIYSYNKEGENALDLAEGNADTIFLLTTTIKSIISSYKKIKNVSFTVFPIFLWSLKMGKISLSKWLLSKLNESDEKKLINDSNKFGMNAILSSCKGGQMSSLQFLLSNRLFEIKILSKIKDINGLTALHYSCYTETKHSISCLRAILHDMELNYSDLLNYSDNDGNTPFDCAMKQTDGWKDLKQWIITSFIDGDKDKQNGNYKIMRILFNRNQKGQVVMIDRKNRLFELKVAVLIRNYFDNIEEISSLDLEFAGYSLLYLVPKYWNLQKLIVSKAQNASQMFKILNIQNSNGYTVLHFVCSSKEWFMIDWFLSEIVEDNHPILSVQNTFDGKSALMFLLENGNISLAQKLIHKIHNKKERLKLIQMKDKKNKSILDYAKYKDIPSQINWIQNQIKLNTK